MLKLSRVLFRFPLSIVCYLLVALGCVRDDTAYAWEPLDQTKFSSRSDIIAPVPSAEGGWRAFYVKGGVLSGDTYENASYAFQNSSLLGAEQEVAQQGVLLWKKYRWCYVNSQGSHEFPALVPNVWRVTNLGESLFAVEVSPKERSDEVSHASPSPVSVEPTLVFDPYGQWNPPPGTTAHDRISEGLLAVSRNGKLGFADRKGTIQIEPQFDAVFPFREGLAAVRIEKKWGFVDKSGTMVIPAKYRREHSFDDGQALVQLADDKDGIFIDQQGNEVAPWPYHTSAYPAGGLVRLYDSETKRIGYKNFQGAWEIKPKFEFAGIFTEGLAFVQSPSTGKSGYIDRSGKYAIPFMNAEKLTFFTHGCAWVVLNQNKRQYGYINCQGEWIWKAKQ